MNLTPVAVQAAMTRRLLKSLGQTADTVAVAFGRDLRPLPRKRGRRVMFNPDQTRAVMTSLLPSYRAMKADLVKVGKFYRVELGRQSIDSALKRTQKIIRTLAPSLPQRHGWKDIATMLRTSRRTAPAQLAARLAASALPGNFTPADRARFERLLIQRKRS